jgi:hypothetical protein
MRHTATLTNRGFSKLNYYIEEQIALEYIDAPTERSSVDIWVYHILAEIAHGNWAFDCTNLQLLCECIYIETKHSETSKYPQSMIKAITFINTNNFIDWSSLEDNALK